NQSLLLCWKIRIGFRKLIEIERIKAYSNWFYTNNLLPHFDIEEKFVFPILGKQHDLVKLSLSKHRRLKKLFDDEVNIQKSLSLIEEELETHVRFEKRKLLIEVQKVASPIELKLITKMFLELPIVEIWADEFWK
ncbi:MAG TPA: hypothetical protein VFM99_03975, partial [Chitinophagales bacterium]|nr:hypothetical protein [Chitinophagales bacterium]